MNSSRGFSLIELMIAVAIIAILATVAFPGVSSYLHKADSSAVQQFMMDIANREKQYLIDNRRYLAVPPGAFSELDNLQVPEKVTDFFTVIVTTPTASTFTITATGLPGKRHDGETYTLTSQGNKNW